MSTQIWMSILENATGLLGAMRGSDNTTDIAQDRMKSITTKEQRI